MYSELCVICLVASRKWTSLVKPNPVNYMYFVAWHMTESLLQNFITQRFHRRWLGAEKSITQISWFVTYFEDEKWRYIMLLEKWCDSLHFHSVTWQHFFKLEYTQLVSQAIKTYQSKPRASRAFHLSSRTIGKSSLWQTIPKIGYLRMLIGSEVYSIVTYLLSETKTMPIVTTGACAVVTKTKK